MLRQPPAIETYGGGGFRVGGARIEGSILILADVATPWPARRTADLTPADFELALAADPAAVEFVLLGAGAHTAMAPRPVRDAMKAASLGLEVMSTPEACRLYNVLAVEGRRVAAALLAV